MKKILIPILLCFAASSYAQSLISLDLGNQEALEAEDIAGLYPTANWNNPRGFPLFSNVALVDSDGAATTATATATGFNGNITTNVAVTADPNTEMFNRGIRLSETNPPQLTIAGLTDGSYDVVAYFDSLSGATGSADINFSIGETSIDVTDLDLGSANYTGSLTESVNYVEFTGIAGTGFTLDITSSEAGVVLTGLQIQASAIPEPSTVALLSAFLTVGFVAYRRRK